MKTTQRLRLHANWITTTFALAIVALAAVHVAMQSIRYHFGKHEFYGLVRLFDMGVEGNLPTFFSSLQLLVACLVVAAIGWSARQAQDRFSGHWLWLALILFLLAADEVSEMHEMSIRPIRELAPWLVTGVFYWAWVIPAAVLVLVVALTYARFVFQHLPKDTRNSTLAGAALFVGGAIGVEMPEARYAEQYGIDNFTYALFVLAEETMEMTGVLVFLSGALKYASRETGPLTVQVVKAPAAPASVVPESFGDTQPPRT